MDERTESKLLLTIPEVVHRLGVGRTLVYRLIMCGELPSIKVGKARRVPVSALEEFIAVRLEEGVRNGDADENEGWNDYEDL